MEAKTPANGRDVPGEYFAVGIRIDDPARRDSLKLTPPGPEPPPPAPAPPEPERKWSYAKRQHAPRKASDLSGRGKEVAQEDTLDDLTDEELISRFARPDKDERPTPALDDRVVNCSKIPPKPNDKPKAEETAPAEATIAEYDPVNTALRDIARDLYFDQPKAYRTFARLTGGIAVKMLSDWQKVGNWLGTLAPEIAAEKITALVKRREIEAEEAEALADMERGERRSLLLKVAIETGNPRLGALVFSVTRGTYAKHLRGGKRFTSKWLGAQIGVSKHQAQRLIRQALGKKYLGGRRIRSGWVLWASEAARDQFAREITCHYDVALSKKLKSIAAAIVLDMADPQPKGEPFEEPAPVPGWQSRFTAQAVVDVIPWLTLFGARRVLEKLVTLKILAKVKSGSRKTDSIFEYQLVQSRWTCDGNKENC